MTVGTDMAKLLADVVDRDIRVMHVCGTHEAIIAKYGIRSVLPSQLKIVMGPGCPVCITPQGEIDAACELAERGCMVAIYGDLLRVPGTKRSLEQVNGNVQIVMGAAKAVEIARQNPDKEIVFVSVGFETTVPTVAATLLTNPPKNFSVLVSHRLVPPVMKWLMDQGGASLDGFILPGHVCAVMGYHGYEAFPMPQVIAGFEPEDILLSFLMIARQIKSGEIKVENAYPRVVTREGNIKAQKLMQDVFVPTDVEWRGFPVIPDSGLKLKPEFEVFDAQKKFDLVYARVTKNSGCICDKVLRGLADPSDCKLYGKACTPRIPIGPCMVSCEGACRIWYQYQLNKQ
ncbi:MAG: hydrogenase formation protein HypD [Methanocalculaceae archaeon]|jgi:hydrogenase expression/formation protein HypD|nr:hydrogenase formation protein HypD [Methanocalculaceae archaeon]